MHLLTEEEGSLALQAARAFVESAVTGNPIPEFRFTETFGEKRGVFVTLTEFGDLRGCIGFPYPILALADALQEAAVSAALRDPRFYPVAAGELADIHVEVTVLTAPILLEVPAEERADFISVGKHGLIAEAGGRSGLLLPQVADEYGWNSCEFLSQTCVKAGLPSHAWKDEQCVIKTFEGQIFTENDINGSNI